MSALETAGTAIRAALETGATSVGIVDAVIDALDLHPAYRGDLVAAQLATAIENGEFESVPALASLMVCVLVDGDEVSF